MINLICIKLHANYSEEYERDEFSDVYLAHRLCQLYELMQFVKHTSRTACATLLLGDLNTYDYEVGFKMLTSHTNLIDAYIEANVFKKKFRKNNKKYLTLNLNRAK